MKVATSWIGRWAKRVVMTLATLVVLLGVMQVIPYGRTHSNPPVIAEPAWDSPRTRELAKRACFDCHSNETTWPWYARVAPMSWVMQRDVDAARSVMNVSEWTRPNDMAHQAGSEVIRREMPPRSYRMLHGEAHLTEDEKVELARGLQITFGAVVSVASAP